MPDVPRPGMPQDEKDRLGAELREAELRAERVAAGEPVADEELDALTKDQLLEEAERRGVEVKTSARKDEIAAALRGEAPAQAQPEGEVG